MLIGTDHSGCASDIPFASFYPSFASSLNQLKAIVIADTAVKVSLIGIPGTADTKAIISDSALALPQGRQPGRGLPF
jgi:hypothetical protein